jgi:hypothetical protein
MLEIRGDVSIDLSRGLVGKPVAITPGVFYGISDRLTVGLTDARFCLTGTSGGCARIYDSIGLDAIFAFMTGNLDVGAHGGVDLASFDPAAAGLRVGVLGKLTSGPLAVTLDPSLRLGLTERDFNPDTLRVPIQVAFQATPELAPFLETGLGTALNGPVSGDFVVPVGVGALYSISRQLDAGLRFTFPNLVGKGGSADYRVLNVFVNFRS